MTLHYTSGSGGSGVDIAKVGFNLADVSSVSSLNALPEGMKGLVWLGESTGATSTFIAKVKPFIGNPKLFGFYLCDEPDITGKWSPPAVSPSSLKAESDWIHANVPGAKTFIALMSLGNINAPNFMNTYNPANTGIDFYGAGVYPIRSEAPIPDYASIDRVVAALIASGIPLSKIVPIYQAFGGGSWSDGMGGKYVLPTAVQMQIMLDRWRALVPNPAFEYAYAWGQQQGDFPLSMAPELQTVFKIWNAAPVPTPAPTPVPAALMLNGQVATQASIDALVAAAGKSAATIAAIKGLVA